MTPTAQRLYELLPAIYRLRDAEQGWPLKSLISVIAEQVAVLEEDIDQLYDDQFIETCADWVVPYIGDLIGYRTLYSVVPKLASSRAEVANTIRYRRRKGTATMLEQLARDVTGWNARVVEFFEILATTQYMNHIRPGNWYAPDLRHWEPLERLQSPFDTIAHTVEVRKIRRGEGHYNIPNIGIYLWRLNAYSLTKSPASKIDDRRYMFNPLGTNTPLFTHPVTEDDITHLASPINVPMAIGRRDLREYLTDYYGDGKSILVLKDGMPVDASNIQSCNLSDDGIGWAHSPKTRVAIDPVLGRIAFPTTDPPPQTVEVTFHYGFSTDVGGGEYQRLLTIDSALNPVTPVTSPQAIQGALAGSSGGGAIEITDSGRYVETLSIAVDPAKRIELRAANGHRPTVFLGGNIEVAGGPGSQVTINGLLVTGGGVQISATAGNAIQKLRLRHCTLVPGIDVDINGTPLHPERASLVVDIPDVEVEIDHCIVGSVRVSPGSTVVITDSIVDAIDDSRIAYAAPDESAGGAMTIERSTVIGKIHTVQMNLVSNAIIQASLAQPDTWTTPVRSDRRQTGCVRFSFLPFVSRVPRRYKCQPATSFDELRVSPQFTSRHYGDPGYAQLSMRTATEVRRGADDEAEMGALHDLYQPQRETNLTVRLEEYLRFGLEAGMFYAT